MMVHQVTGPAHGEQFRPLTMLTIGELQRLLTPEARLMMMAGNESIADFLDQVRIILMAKQAGWLP